jgi:hypothetical protein
MTYGYYLAQTRTRHGDPDLSRLSRLLWRQYGHRVPTRVDGVSVWIRDGIAYHCTIIADHLLDPSCNPVTHRLLP